MMNEKKNNDFIPINTAKSEKDMIVYITSGYKKEIKDQKTIVNNTFELGEKIGQGSFWSVRKVKRNLLSKEGVLLDNNYYVFKKGLLNKRICILGDEDSEGETRIGLKEYNIIKNICHPNIARLYECIIDEKKNKIVFVMEYCDLGSLMKIEYNDDGDESYIYNKKVLDYLWMKYEKGKETPSQYSYENESHSIFLETITIEIIKQLINALNYLHNEKIVAHLDIKPDNILFKTPVDGSENFVKLSDFSISRKLKDKTELLSLVGGTPLYEPPERETTDLTNPFLSDIYSLGKTMYSFLFQTIDFEELKEKISKIKNIQLRKFFELTIEDEPEKRIDVIGLCKLFKS